MNPRWKIICETCDFQWSNTGQSSVYEQQVIESKPCPSCNSYTLSCRSVDSQQSIPTREILKRKRLAKTHLKNTG